MATAPEKSGPAPGGRAGPDDDFGVLVGWAHAPIPQGIQLKVQSKSAAVRGGGDVATRSYLMTRNQALILANYLLEVTGQTLPRRTREGGLRRFWRRITGG